MSHYEYELTDAGVSKMTDGQMLERAEEGFFVGNAEDNYVYCPQGKMLRQKTISLLKQNLCQAISARAMQVKRMLGGLPSAQKWIMGKFIMNSEWNNIFDSYVTRIISPDGRDTFESNAELVSDITDMAKIDQSHTVIDIGSGWGNVTMPLSMIAKKVIGIELDKKNIKEAQKRAEAAEIENIAYIHGSFENPKYAEKADRIVSSLVFHQVKPDKREESLLNVKNLLTKNGMFILCDTFMFFDPENDSVLFNKVYRYLLPKTTPVKIYEKYIKPHMEGDLDHVYTWEEMKEYTPKENWYYSKTELEIMLKKIDMKIIEEKVLSPFFGIVVIKNKDAQHPLQPAKP